jgi:hypothetical protein
MADNTQSDPNDMGVRSNRLSVIDRYNRCVGAPGPEAQPIQNEFLGGLMDPLFVASFVAEYEVIIASRRPMHKPANS